MKSAQAVARYSAEMHRRLNSEGWDLGQLRLNAFTHVIVREFRRLVVLREQQKEITADEAALHRETASMLLVAIDLIKARRGRGPGGGPAAR